jgi:hypothetical protein
MSKPGSRRCTAVPEQRKEHEGTQEHHDVQSPLSGAEQRCPGRKLRAMHEEQQRDGGRSEPTDGNRRIATRG